MKKTITVKILIVAMFFSTQSFAFDQNGEILICGGSMAAAVPAAYQFVKNAAGVIVAKAYKFGWSLDGPDEMVQLYKRAARVHGARAVAAGAIVLATGAAAVATCPQAVQAFTAPKASMAPASVGIAPGAGSAL